MRAEILAHNPMNGQESLVKKSDGSYAILTKTRKGVTDRTISHFFAMAKLKEWKP